MREIREKRNLTQQQVADMMHVHRTTYNAWENGKDFISFSRLYQFALLFNVSLDYLIGKAPFVPIEYPRATTLDKNVVGEKIKNFRESKNLSQEQLAKILNVSQGSISNYETGNTLITTSYILTLVNKYDCSLDDFTQNKNS